MKSNSIVYMDGENAHLSNVVIDGAAVIQKNVKERCIVNKGWKFEWSSDELMRKYDLGKSLIIDILLLNVRQLYMVQLTKNRLIPLLRVFLDRIYQHNLFLLITKLLIKITSASTFNS